MSGAFFLNFQKSIVHNLRKLYRFSWIGFGKAAAKLKTGDAIEVTVPEPEPLDIQPEKVDFQVLFEDADILVIAKPPGVVVHPASGHKQGTLVHGLLARALPTNRRDPQVLNSLFLIE